MRYFNDKNLKRCIVCGHDYNDTDIVCDYFAMYAVRCRNCYAYTKWFNTYDEAVDEWQKKNTIYKVK